MQSLLLNFVPVLNTGRVRHVGLALVLISEISFLLLRVDLSDFSDIMVWHARDLIVAFAVVRIRRLRHAHGQHLLGRDAVVWDMNLFGRILH